MDIVAQTCIFHQQGEFHTASRPECSQPALEVAEKITKEASARQFRLTYNCRSVTLTASEKFCVA